MSVDRSVPKPIPLRLFLLAHPNSESAGLLAQELMRRFVDPPASGGLRLPVFFTPNRGDGKPPDWHGDDGINLDASAHTLVVVLADARMALKASFNAEKTTTGTEWKKFLDEGAQKAPVGASPHHVFAVAIAKARNEKEYNDSNVFALGQSRHVLGVTKEPERNTEESSADYAHRCRPWVELAADEISLQISIRAIRLLTQKKLPPNMTVDQKAPVRLFLSHAKADLTAEESDPVRRVEDAIQELPIEAWFDAAKIRPGESFESEITAGLQDCTVLISFLTDNYASRPWCQREILDAKRLGAPILVVDALKTGEPRNFPYLGNLPTMRWTGETSKQTPGAETASAATADGKPSASAVANASNAKVQARRIVGRAVREALRFLHNRAVLQRWKAKGETIVATAPEALVLAWYGKPSKQISFLYPDPPLTKDELKILCQLRPKKISLQTPLTKLADWKVQKKPAGLKCIAVSTSVSNDKHRWGLTPQHEESIFDELHGYLLMAGLQIGYGGALMANFQSGTNFTLRLFELARSYSLLADNAGAGKIKPIINYAPWPLRQMYGDAEAALFGDPSDPDDKSFAHLVRPAEPPESEIPRQDEHDPALFPAGADLFTLPDTAPRRLAWTRGLTLMRQQMTEQTQARIVIGGKLLGFSGLYPGVVEEAWLSIVTKRPLYLVGTFGGAARAVIDLLEGRIRSEVGQPQLGKEKTEQENARMVADILKLAEQRGLKVIGPGVGLPNPLDLTGQLVHPERIAADLRSASGNGLAAALNNGLDDDENRELVRSTDPPRIAELILMGLSRCHF